MNGKRALNLFTGNLAFLVLNILFFAILFIFVARSGTGTGILEEKYSKEIALAIDSMKKGSEISLDLSEVYKTAEKNNIENPVIIDASANKVNVKLTAGEGHSHIYFSEVSEGADFAFIEDKILKIKV